jgi:two-component system sensor histidine kinase BaeS
MYGKSMRVKLYYKIFAAFLLTSIMVVGLMIGIMRFYVARNFTDFVHKEALERLDNLTVRLAKEYQQNGWQRLEENPKIWRKIVRAALPRKEMSKLRPGRGPDDPNEGIPTKSIPFSDDKSEEQVKNTPPPPPAIFTRRGLSLFDKQKKLIVGRPVQSGIDHYSLREIADNGLTIGWVGFPKRELMANPRVQEFLKQQTRVFWLIGGGILLLAATVAFVLSKHLLAPIKKLTDGTQALTSRKFDTRIHVHSKDELGQLANDFNLMAATLRKYEISRQQWITDISHELRTPIAILRGEIEAIQDGVREMTPEALESLKSEVTHLNKLVEDLHILSRADAQSLTNKRESIDALAVLQRAFNAFRNRLNGHHIDIEMDIDDRHQIFIKGDEDWLTRLYFNLFENTLKYSDSPGILAIRGGFTENKLVISFEDSDPSVPADTLPKLFDRLYRVEKSRNRSSGGSGLGLSICKEIVVHHNGEIYAQIGSLGGLMIVIKFPVVKILTLKNQIKL